MLDDMTRSARVAVDLTRVSRFIDAIPETVSQLEAWGLALDRDESGALVRRRAGGLSEPRIVSTGGGLGPQLMAALRRGLEESGAELRTGTRVVGIKPGAEGIALDVVSADGAGRVIGRAVVVSTGGRSHAVAAGRGERSTNPANGNAAMAALVRDLGVDEVPGDYFQYQPFGVVDAPGPFARCVPESVVTFEPSLLDRHGGDVGGVGEDRLDLTARMFAVADAGDAVDAMDGPGVWLALGGPEPRPFSPPSPSWRDPCRGTASSIASWGRGASSSGPTSTIRQVVSSPTQTAPLSSRGSTWPERWWAGCMGAIA